MAARAVLTSVASSFGVMSIGLYASRSGWLDTAQRKGIAMLYAQLVFPMMVFKGVAAITPSQIDLRFALVIVVSKAVLASIVIMYGMRTLRSSLGAASLSHAAAFAMAASHSFDVTLGVPLARELFPKAEAYVYLNQSIQLVAINPVLLILMDLGATATKGHAKGIGRIFARTMLATACNPLVIFTAAGMTASCIWPAGLPPVLAALAAQVSSAGPCLGFLCLGFALGALGGTTAGEVQHAAVLCGAKLVLMPGLYVGVARVLGCQQSSAFFMFLGSLPASASVYSLTLTRALSPRVVGPLVPASMLLSLCLSLAPLSSAMVEAHVAEVFRVAIAIAATVACTAAMCTGGKPDARNVKKA